MDSTTSSVILPLLGFIAAVVATVVSWCVFFFGAPPAHGEEPLILGVMPVTWILLSSTVAMVLVSLLTSPPPASPRTSPPPT